MKEKTAADTVVSQKKKMGGTTTQQPGSMSVE
jgi:hypothetical protein